MTPRCAKVLMPEGGVYTMRIDAPESAEELAGHTAVVLLDYGVDAGLVLEPAAPPSGTPPGFAVLRLPTAKDAEALRENEAEAEAFAADLVKGAASSIPGFKLFSARLSLAKRKIFVRFAASPQRVGPERLARALGRRCPYCIDARQLGARDQAAESRAMGECGRVCCRALLGKSRRGPQRAPGCGPLIAKSSPRAFGTCGCVKCCLEFENTPIEGSAQ